MIYVWCRMNLDAVALTVIINLHFVGESFLLEVITSLTAQNVAFNAAVLAGSTHNGGFPLTFITTILGPMGDDLPLAFDVIANGADCLAIVRKASASATLALPRPL